MRSGKVSEQIVIDHESRGFPIVSHAYKDQAGLAAIRQIVGKGADGFADGAGRFLRESFLELDPVGFAAVDDSLQVQVGEFVHYDFSFRPAGDASVLPREYRKPGRGFIDARRA